MLLLVVLVTGLVVGVAQIVSLPAAGQPLPGSGSGGYVQTVAF